MQGVLVDDARHIHARRKQGEGDRRDGEDEESAHGKNRERRRSQQRISARGQRDAAPGNGKRHENECGRSRAPSAPAVACRALQPHAQQKP